MLIDNLQEQLVSFLQDLVRIANINNGQDDCELEIAKRIESEARKFELNVNLYAHPEKPNRPNVVVSIGILYIWLSSNLYNSF